MKSRFLGALGVMLASAGWAVAQPPVVVNPPGAAGVSSSPASAAVAAGGSGMTNGGTVYPVVPTFGTPMSDSPAVLPESGTGDALRWYGNAEFIVWRIPRGSIPSTATAVPAGVSSIIFTNRYYDANQTLIRTQTVVGYNENSITNQVSFANGGQTDLGSLPGGRFVLGFWGDADQTWGVEAAFQFLASKSTTISGRPSLSNDQFIINTGFRETDYQIPPNGGAPVPTATYDVLAIRQVNGTFSGSASSSLWGGELNYRSTAMRVGPVDVSGLCGFRYLQFEDALNVNSTINLSLPPGVQRTAVEESYSLSENLVISSTDNIRIRNQFIGAQIGVDLDARFASLFLFTRLKAAVGDMHQSASIDGNTQVINNEPIRLTGPRAGSATSPPSSVSPGGLLSAPGDSGGRDRDRVAVIPEVNVRFGCQFTNWLRGTSATTRVSDAGGASR
ncbi:MAG: BBP7 family outer membrane beta-barrel protein [Gemmataceae bacterium]